MNLQQQIDIGMLAWIVLRIGDVFGKPVQTLRGGGGIEFTTEIQCQSGVEFQRALLAGGIGDVMDGFALCVEDVASASNVGLSTKNNL